MIGQLRGVTGEYNGNQKNKPKQRTNKIKDEILLYTWWSDEGRMS